MLPLMAEQCNAARRAMTSSSFDYITTGAGDEVAAREAESAWLRYRTLPRVLRDVARADAALTLLGTELTTPILVAPTAFHGLAHPDGERATRRGTAAAGSLAVVSMRASLALEDVAEAVTAPWWFQVYVLRDRGVTRALVERAAAAGATALVLTGDTPYVGAKPRLAEARSPVPAGDLLVNAGQHLPAGADVSEALEQSPSATWADIEWLAGVAGLPVVVKGVLRADDALCSLDSGASGVVVSNHGGRQSSRAVSTAVALPAVAEAVAGRAPVLVDGGIRSGADALVALALGATAVMVGRPVLWALAAGGADGVRDVLTALTDDLLSQMRLVGAAGLAEIDASLVQR